MFIVRARYVIPLSESNPDERIEDGYLLADGNEIIEVGKYSVELGEKLIGNHLGLSIIGKDDPRATRYPNDSVPMLNGILMPGFVKAHGHADEAPMIGLFKETKLKAWLDECVNPFNRMVKDKVDEILKLTDGVNPKLEVYRKSLLDDIFFGTTSVQYHHCNYNKYHVPELVQAVMETGLKCVVAVGSQDRNYNPDVLDIPYTKAIERLDKYYDTYMANNKQGGKYSRVEIIPGPDQDFSNSEEMLKAQTEWAKAHGCLIHIHSSEDKDITEWFTREYGKTPVQHLQSGGVLSENCNVAHQVHTTDADLDLLQQSHTGIVHNPLANTILGDGMPRLLEMVERGIRVAISTDGTGSADMQNMIAAVRLVAEYYRAKDMVPHFKSSQLLSMATRIPAQMLRLKTGQLIPSYRSDWILIDCSVPNMIPTHIRNCMENIIWSATGNEVSYVCSEGVMLMEDHRYKNIPFDIPHVHQSVQRLSELFIDYLEEDEKGGM